MAASDIRHTIAAIEKTAVRTIKRIGFSISGQLVRSTPVDTGWARANWVISIGRPLNEPVGNPGSVNSAAQSAGQGRLLVYRLNMGDVWISNNVPYILKLNQGHSPQAAAGWIERAVDAGVAAVGGGGG